jgi:hypothetical protein
VQPGKRSGFIRTIALAGVIGTCLAATACGGGGGDPLANTSAKTIVTDAVNNLKAASTATMKGTITESGQDMAVDLGYKNGTGCSGTVTLNGKGTLTLVVIGTTAYMKMDDAFLQAVAGSEASAAIALINGRYIEASTSDSNVSSFSSLCNLDSLSSSFAQSDADNFKKGAVTTLNGQQVVPVTDESQGGTMYVTNTSSPQVVEITSSGGNNTSGSTGTLTFDIGAPVTLTAPPSSEVIDGSSIGF